LARLLSTAFLVAMLAATGWAFALTQRAKRELSPIHRTQVDRIFSPACDCELQSARILFHLREDEPLTVWVEREGERLRTLVSNQPYSAGPVSLVFEGITERGETLPDGTYHPVVRLEDQHRTIRLPNEIVLDTKPPMIRVPRRVYTHISPDGDGRKDVVRVPYRVSEPANAILRVGGRRVAYTRFRRTEGVLRWNGRIRGRLAAEGNHVLTATARDRAGNVARPRPFAVVRIRYVQLGRDRVVARPGTHFPVLVLADAPVVRWRLARRSGTARPVGGRTTLRLRAPTRIGVYQLVVSGSGHAARATVVVG
jgi:hypothetical protein